jgi:putative heme-binding domain-containing protein
MRTLTTLLAAIMLLANCQLHAAPPVLLDDQFDMPDGFHIYRAAEPGLTGGSYDLTFDGDGRLLVGDGQNVRRLKDADGDGVYDSQEIIATGLGGRGPQGLLVFGDNLYAVGGDGVQLFSGYKSGGTLKHEGRLGAPFSTGGDHAAHTLLRGLDGWIYLVTGDGGGTGGRNHITEESSPVLNERAASVFRFSPDGEKWECIGAGGRNPPSLGMNYLGEFFSFDSDMEWHVDVPFYRPVRLNHWATGADLGWQGAGAFPPYYIDTIPGILDVGRGSPTSGVFYEHMQFPQAYRDAFLCCDYQWKSATSGGYDKSGRLVSFEMERAGATWKAKMSVLAQAKPGAKDATGRPINFAVVDVDVAMDGSILISDHNQGLWRIFYAAGKPTEIPPVDPRQGRDPNLGGPPQPAAEWSHLRQPAFPLAPLRKSALDEELPMTQRLHAIRLLAAEFDRHPGTFIGELCAAGKPEIRGQAAWLIGIRGRAEEVPLLVDLLKDEDPFVRRRTAEALSRFGDARATKLLIVLLGDADRHVRYAAMTALAHRPSEEFLKPALENQDLRVGMRALVAANIRGERPPAELVHLTVPRLAEWDAPKKGDVLDRLRVMSLFQKEVEQDTTLAGAVHDFLLADFPSEDPDIRWEQVRLIGQYHVGRGFGPLLTLLETERDGTKQFHIAMALAGISTGWTDEESARLAKWLASVQTGWFAELQGKGRQFGGFWATTLNQLAEKHASGLAGIIDEIIPGSQLASIAFRGLDARPDADKIVIRHYRAASSDAARLQLLDVMATMSRPGVGKFIIEEQKRTIENPALQKRLLKALASQPLSGLEVGQIFLMALVSSDDAEVAAICARRVGSEGRPVSAYSESLREVKIGQQQGTQALYFRLLELMARQPGQAAVFEAALSTLAGESRPGSGTAPEVIWSSAQQIDNDQAWFAREFEIPDEPSAAELAITCDNEFTAFINGKQVAASRAWENPLRVDVLAALRAGKNVIAVHGVNQGGPAGLIAKLKWQSRGGKSGALSTNSSWRLSLRPSESWQTDGANDGATWAASTIVSGPTKNALDAFRAFEPFDAPAGRIAAQEHWQDWYRNTYAEAFVARPVVTQKPFADNALHALIMQTQDLAGGDAANGRQVYLSAGCFACHGGLDKKGATLFGPPLAGAALRLNRQELADAIVYPSKLVAERFRATVLETTEGDLFNGFITENSDAFVSITDLQNKVTRLPKGKVKSLNAQATSLMPAKLLNALSDKQVLDLLAFLAKTN